MFTGSSFYAFCEKKFPDVEVNKYRKFLEGGLDKIPKALWKERLFSVVKEHLQEEGRWNPAVEEGLREMYATQLKVAGGFFAGDEIVRQRTRKAVERLCLVALLQKGSDHSNVFGEYRPTKKQRKLLESLGSLYQEASDPTGGEHEKFCNYVSTITLRMREHLQSLDPEQRALYEKRIHQDLLQLKAYRKKCT